MKVVIGLVISSGNGSTVTFTFKARSSTQSYSPKVNIKAFGLVLMKHILVNCSIWLIIKFLEMMSYRLEYQLYPALLSLHNISNGSGAGINFTDHASESQRYI